MSFHILVVGTNLEFFSCFNRQKWSALDLISCLKFLSFIITKLELMHFPDCQRRNIWKHFRNNTAEIFCCAPGRPKGYTPHVRMRADGDIRSATCHPYLFSRVGICSTCSCTLLFLSFSLLIFVLAVCLSVSLSFPLPPSASLPSCATRRPSSVVPHSRNYFHSKDKRCRCPRLLLSVNHSEKFRAECCRMLNMFRRLLLLLLLGSPPFSSL